MELILRAEVARRCGVSPPAIGKAVKAGKLMLVGLGRDAKIDWHAALTKDYFLSTNSQRKPEPAPKLGDGKTSDLLSQRPNDGNSKHTHTVSPLSAIDELTDAQFRVLTTGDLARYAGIEKIQEARIRNQKARGELIERDMVAKLLGLIFQVDTTQLLTLPTRLLPELASIAKIDNPELLLKLEQIIETEIYAVLKHIKKTVNQGLVELETEPIEPDPIEEEPLPEQIEDE